MQIQSNRESLHDLLVELLGSPNVYFDPPENLKMKYPAIVYNRNNIKNTFAYDKPYKQNCSYIITIIDEDPDSEIIDRISQLPMCTYEQQFTSNGMNHIVFIINY